MALLHVEGWRLKRLHGIPRSAVLSAGSGVSIAYVFVHLLPELAGIQEQLEGTLEGGWLAAVETHAWIVALFGLAIFYGLELAARRSDDHHAKAEIGWIRVGSYTVYNGVVGYLLHARAEESVTTLVLFAVALGVHFLVNDHGLREHHGALYHRTGRWVVGAGVVAGAALGAIVELSEPALGILIALLAGGIIMNVLKEELPEGRAARWGPFVGGAAAYSALLLVA